jgi:hypothetical protein
MRGRRSRDSAGARSRSNGEVVKGAEGVDVAFDLDDLGDVDDLSALAESTSAI